MNQPFISIIVPCYNQAQYLDECLQSVFNQTYQNWECIIVNDGSPDNTEEIALQWTKKDVRFKYLNKENGGLSSARNAGIEIAKGEWILPLDCDDKIGNRYLELAEKEFDKGYTVIYCKAEFFGDINTKWDLPKYSYTQLLSRNLIFCSGFFKKNDWDKVNGYDVNLIYGREDWDFWLSILDLDSKVLRLDYFGFYYRRKSDSMDVELNINLEKKIYSENYIYKKHLIKYLPNNLNAIDNYNISARKQDELSNIYRDINNNLLTRFLFKLIKFIS